MALLAILLVALGVRTWVRDVRTYAEPPMWWLLSGGAVLGVIVCGLWLINEALAALSAALGVGVGVIVFGFLALLAWFWSEARS